MTRLRLLAMLLLLPLTLMGCTPPSPTPAASPTSSSSATPTRTGVRPPHPRPTRTPVVRPTARPTAPQPTPSSPLGLSCGVERWHVKTGTDAGVGSLNTAPQDTTIAALRSAPVPSGAAADQRFGPVETTTYRITALVTAYKTEADSDVHLALDDGTGQTMIAEIPDASCAVGSPFRAQIAAARSLWQGAHPESPMYQAVRQQVVLVGVGFFDRLHGQRGVAPNGIELHPVLSITLK